MWLPPQLQHQEEPALLLSALLKLAAVHAEVLRDRSSQAGPAAKPASSNSKMALKSSKLTCCSSAAGVGGGVGSSEAEWLAPGRVGCPPRTLRGCRKCKNRTTASGSPIQVLGFLSKSQESSVAMKLQRWRSLLLGLELGPTPIGTPLLPLLLMLLPCPGLLPSTCSLVSEEAWGPMAGSWAVFWGSEGGLNGVRAPELCRSRVSLPGCSLCILFKGNATGGLLPTAQVHEEGAWSGGVVFCLLTLLHMITSTPERTERPLK